MSIPLRLTNRGRGMLLLGPATVGAGLLLGSVALLAAGLFAAIVLALSVGWVLLRRTRVAIRRSEVPLTVAFGQQFPVAATVEGGAAGGPALVVGLIPAWAADPHEDMPAQTIAMALGGPGRRVVRRTGSARRRGVYGWPALRLELPDPLGAVHALVDAPRTGRTVVFPRIEHLGAARVPAIAGGVSEFDDATVLARRVLGDSGGNPIPRPFGPGDELRRMHWPATARTGDPMVRAEDAGPTRRAVLLLDCGEAGYLDPVGFERAVTAAASIAVRLLQLGWAVSVRRASGGSITAQAWTEGRRGEVEVLSALAAVAWETPEPRIPPRQDDPAQAAYAVGGAGGEPSWALAPMTVIRTEHPQPRPEGCLVWDGTLPLAAVWTAGASRVVM